jgi:predicted dehydrogenase
MYSIGIVGTGYMARRHVDIIKDDPRCQLVALCHTRRSTDLAHEWTKAYGFHKITSDYAEFLADPKIDIIWICSPNDCHFQQARLSIASGKHVFCEKPLALSAEQSLILDREARDRGVLLAVGMNCRFRSPFLAIKAQLPFLGNPILIRGTYLYNSEDAIVSKQKEWWLSSSNQPLLITGGLLHTLDLMIWLGGEISSVTALGGNTVLGNLISDDTLAISMRFKNGGVGELVASFVSQGPNNMSIDYYGKSKSVIANQLVMKVDSQNKLIPLDVTQPVLDLKLQLDNIIGAIEGRKDLINTAAESFRNLCVCESIQQSLLESRVVTVNYRR